MHCDKAKSLLGWYYDDELDAADHKLVAEHLAHCSACAGELAALVQLDRVSRQLVAPEPPPGVWERIASRLIAHESGQPAREQVLRRRHFLLAAGVLAASVVAGTLTYQLRRGDPGTPDSISPPNHSDQADPVAVNLALLGPDDQRLAQSQRTCAGRGCDALLGSCGCPVKLVVQNQPVFLCGKECEQWARAHPAEALAKLHTLESGHEGPKKR
jgi:hypothetical protein